MDSLNWVESHHAAPQAPPVVNTHDKKLKISWVLTAALVAVALHPLPIVAKASKPSLPGEMLLTLFISLGAFTLLYIAFVRARYKYAVERERITPAREAYA